MKHVLSLSLLALIFVTGCVSVPTESFTKQITADELSQHVDFLTQPRLKGRAAGSWESKHVRDYLSQRLQAYGCVPWGKNPSFELDFGFGKNIIGVLPGSDPELSKEIVLISAHFDHLKPKWFSYYPGAADNAAAVAVLLEIAEKLSRVEQKPKRSICFAFFDAEEMGCLGSFAFTCRDDYDDSKIVAVINMDLLGRDLLDVVDNSLIVTGTENYHSLHNNISTTCAQSDLKFIPLQTELLGPVSDHMAFVSNNRPALFFTCGINKDYHQPTDTSDKLNFSKLKKEGFVVENTLLALANADSTLLTRSSEPVIHQRVKSFSHILDTFKEHQDFFKLDPNDIETLDKIIAKTKLFSPNTISNAELLHLERESLGELMKLLKNYDKRLSQYGSCFLQVSKFYSMAPELINKAYRDMVKYYLENKPSIFKNNDYAYKKYLPVTKDDWAIAKTDEGEFIFGLLEHQFHSEVDVNLLKRSSASFGLNARVYACKGSLTDIADYIFLEISRKKTAIKNQAVINKPEDALASTFPEIYQDKDALQRIEEWRAVQKDIVAMFPEETRPSKSNGSSDPNYPLYFHERWYLTHFQHGSPPLGYAKEIRFSDSIHSIEDAKKEFARLLPDPNTHPEIRAGLIGILEETKQAFSLNALVNILDSTTPYDTTPWWLYHKDFPLADHPLFKEYIPEIKKYYEEHKPTKKAFGQMAQEALKKATGQDFGKDKEAWKKWIEKHY